MKFLGAALPFLAERFQNDWQDFGQNLLRDQLGPYLKGSNGIELQVLAYESLISFARELYDLLLPNYFPFLAPIFIKPLTIVLDDTHAQDTEDTERLIFVAVEFWASICECEDDRGMEIGQSLLLADEGHQLIQCLLSSLLPLLVKQEVSSKINQGGFSNDSDIDEEIWTIQAASATCLASIAERLGEGLLLITEQQASADNTSSLFLVPTFIETALNRTESNWREAGLLAFGSIVHPNVRASSSLSPDKSEMISLSSGLLRPLASMTHAVLPILLGRGLTDQDKCVRDTSCWVIGRIAETFLQPNNSSSHIDAGFNELTESELYSIVNGILISLKDQSFRVASSAAWAIMNVAVQIGEEGAACHHNICSPPIFNHLLHNLIENARRCFLVDKNNTEKSSHNTDALATATFESLSNIVRYAPLDALSDVFSLHRTILSELKIVAKQFNMVSGLHLGLLTLLQATIEKISKCSNDQIPVELDPSLIFEVLFSITHSFLTNSLNGIHNSQLNTTFFTSDDFLREANMTLEILFNDSRTSRLINKELIQQAFVFIDKSLNDSSTCFIPFLFLGTLIRSFGGELYKVNLDKITRHLQILISQINVHKIDMDLCRNNVELVADITLAVASNPITASYFIKNNACDMIALFIELFNDLNTLLSSENTERRNISLLSDSEIGLLEDFRDSVLTGLTAVIQTLSNNSSDLDTVLYITSKFTTPILIACRACVENSEGSFVSKKAYLKNLLGLVG